MLDRCYRETDPYYHLYGGRGICVCREWRETFGSFFGSMGERPEGTTLDRIETNGDYTPDNCRWATVEVQANNRRNSKFLEKEGERLTVAQWARRLGVSRNMLYARIKSGLTTNDVLRA